MCCFNLLLFVKVKSVLYTLGVYNGCLVSLAEVTIMFRGHVFQDSLIGLVGLSA
jgi:hypothetical protein